MLNHSRGASSLLFFASALFAQIKSDNLKWKIFNCWLPLISYLCNASGYDFHWVILDYAVITLLCVSYINEYIVTVVINLLFLIEILTDKNLVITKNAAYVLAITKALFISSVFFNNTIQHSALVVSVAGSLLFYFLRYIRFLVLRDAVVKFEVIVLTWLLHLSVAVTLMCISCLAVTEYDIPVYLQ